MLIRFPDFLFIKFFIFSKFDIISSLAWWIKILDLGEFVAESRPIINHQTTTISTIKTNNLPGLTITISTIRIANHPGQTITTLTIKTASRPDPITIISTIKIVNHPTTIISAIKTRKLNHIFSFRFLSLSIYVYLRIMLYSNLPLDFFSYNDKQI